MQNCSTPRTAFVVLAAAAFLATFVTIADNLPAQAANRGAKESATAASPHLDAGQLALLREQMRKIARDEVSARLDGAEKGAIDAAAQATKDADSTMAFVSWLTTAFIAILGAIAAILLFGELSVFKRTKDHAERIVQDAQQAVGRISQFDAATAKALEEISDYGKNLPTVQLPRVMGSPFELPSADHGMQMEEADILAVLGQRIRGQQESKELAPAFVRLAGYWLNLENYPRAIARYQRAALLDGSCWEAYEGLSRTVSELATRPGLSNEGKMRLLEKSDDWCAIAETVAHGPRAETRAQLGWVADERGGSRDPADFLNASLDFQQAVDYYRQARQLDTKAEKPLILYNLACILSNRLRNFPAALDTLRDLKAMVRIPTIAKSVNAGKIRELVDADHDFDGLRGDPRYAPQLEALLAA